MRRLSLPLASLFLSAVVPLHGSHPAPFLSATSLSRPQVASLNPRPAPLSPLRMRQLFLIRGQLVEAIKSAEELMQVLTLQRTSLPASLAPTRPAILPGACANGSGADGSNSAASAPPARGMPPFCHVSDIPAVPDMEMYRQMVAAARLPAAPMCEPAPALQAGRWQPWSLPPAEVPPAAWNPVADSAGGEESLEMDSLGGDMESFLTFLLRSVSSEPALPEVARAATQPLRQEQGELRPPPAPSASPAPSRRLAEVLPPARPPRHEHAPYKCPYCPVPTHFSHLKDQHAHVNLFHLCLRKEPQQRPSQPVAVRQPQGPAQLAGSAGKPTNFILDLTTP